MALRYRKGFTISLALASVGALCALAGCSLPETASRTFTAMSTVATITLEGADSDAACAAVIERVAQFESATSRFVARSDISRVNSAAGGEAVEIGKDSYIMLTAAADYAAESGGSFDVTIGALTSLWGIGSDDPRLPSQTEIDRARALVGISGLDLTRSGGKYYARLARAGQKLDLGGCAKGYALDLCRAELAKYNIDYGFVSLGGNVMLFGDKGGEGFKVGVRYPEQGSNGSLCMLRLADTCVATTGAYERFFEENGVSYHHVLDPATGYPAQSDLLCASAVCEDGMRGDYLSTRLFMLGEAGALELMRSGAVDAVIVAEGNRVFVSRSLESAFIAESADEAYTFEFV